MNKAINLKSNNPILNVVQGQESPVLELLGIDSQKNKRLKANVEAALRALSLDIPIKEVTNIEHMLQYDIVGIPALVLNGKVISQKMVPEVRELEFVFNLLLKEKPGDFSLDHIVVPTDFSEVSKKALSFAAGLARLEDATIKLVHIHQPHLLESQNLEVEPKIQDLAASEKMLESFPGGVLGLKDRRQLLEPSVAVPGMAVEQIREISSDPDVDLIVMGTTGKGGFLEKVFGSVSSELARKAHCPVLLIPDGVTFKGIHKIIFASNYHPADKKVLPKLLDFARRFGAVIHMVHINENKLDQYLINDPDNGRFYQYDDTTLRMASVDCSNTIEGLNQYASEQKADLLVMATQHRTFLGELFHPSKTQKMIFNIQLPLMVMHFDD